MRRRLGYGTLYAMRRHKAWRGGYSKRSKAAYPPPRCVLDHKLNGFILSYEYTKLIVFAQNLWWMKNESIMTSDDLVMI